MGGVKHSCRGSAPTRKQRPGRPRHGLIFLKNKPQRTVPQKTTLNIQDRVVQKKTIFLHSANYLVLYRVFHAESKYRRKKKSDQRFSYGVLFGVSYGETHRKWSLQRTKTRVFRVVINSYRKALRSINLRNQISRNPEFQLVPPI